MSLGYYSLIQYCPDVGRLEVVNIGLILYCPSPQSIQVRMGTSLRRIKRFFGDLAASPRHFEQLRDGVEARIKAAARGFGGVNDLRQFIAKEANDLLLTDPRPVTIDSVSRTMSELFERLVESKPPAHRRRGVKAMLEDEFSKPEFDGLIARDVSVLLPAISSSIKLPYGYQNGKFNLIQAATFRDEGPAALLNSAGRFQLEGRLIHDADQELVVVGEFPGDDPGLEITVRRLIGSQATLYTADHLDELFDTIRRNAKPLNEHRRADDGS